MLYKKPNESTICCVCRHLLDGKVISTIDEIQHGNGWRLAATIHLLRSQYEWLIDDQRVSLPNSSKRISEYWLMPDFELSTSTIPPTARHLLGKYAHKELILTNPQRTPAQPFLPFNGDWR